LTIARPRPVQAPEGRGEFADALGLDADAPVGHREPQLLAGALAAHLDLRRAARRHELQRVAHQVLQRQRDQRGMAGDGAELGCGSQRAAAGLQLSLQRGRHFLEHEVQRHRLGFGCGRALQAHVLQQVVEHALHARCAFAHLAEVELAVGVELLQRPLFDEHAELQHGVQRLAQVV
jgi:hypothetical protein